MSNPLVRSPDRSPAIDIVARRLGALDADCWLVGEALLEHLCGRRIASPTLATSAAPAQIALALPRAVPVRPTGGSFIVPTPEGTIEIVPLRNGPRIEDDLAARTLTLHAMALSVPGGRLIDPHDGMGDLERRQLRTTGEPEARLRADPLAALRIARMLGETDFEIETTLRAALARTPSSHLEFLPACDLWRELQRLLRSAHPARGLALLRETGLETCVTQGTRDDAAELVEALPDDLVLRLAAWLRDSKPGRTVRRLRVDPAIGGQVLDLLQYHPAEQTIRHDRRSSVVRALARFPSPESRARLLTLRRAELELSAARGRTPADSIADTTARLDRLEVRLEAVASEAHRGSSRPELAIGGLEVMAVLGRGEGPHVGRALRHLRERVEAAPELNRPEVLRNILTTWAQAEEI